MATICITGALGKDAEFKTVGSNDTALLSFSVADSIYDAATKQQKTIWYRCQVWGKRAEGNLKDYLKKGQYVSISGELSVNEYQANDGAQKYSLEVSCYDVKLVGGKKDAHQTPTTAPMQQYQPAPQQQNDEPFYDPEIPF